MLFSTEFVYANTIIFFNLCEKLLLDYSATIHLAFRDSTLQSKYLQTILNMEILGQLFSRSSQVVRSDTKPNTRLCMPFWLTCYYSRRSVLILLRDKKNITSYRIWELQFSPTVLSDLNLVQSSMPVKPTKSYTSRVIDPKGSDIFIGSFRKPLSPFSHVPFSVKVGDFNTRQLLKFLNWTNAHNLIRSRVNNNAWKKSHNKQTEHILQTLYSPKLQGVW